MWVIVLFCKENSVSVIPKCWLTNSTKACCWPPAINVSKHIAKCVQPDRNWHIFEIRLLNEGKVYDNYLKARAAARLAEETSDINTDNENHQRRKRKRSQKLISSESSEESEEIDELHEENNNFPALPDAPSSASLQVMEDDTSGNTSPIISSIISSRHHSVPRSHGLQIMEDTTDNIAVNTITPIKSRHHSVPQSHGLQIMEDTIDEISVDTSIRSSQHHASIPRSHYSTSQDSTSTKIKVNTDERILHTQKFQQQLSLINFKLNNLQSDVSTIIEFLRKSDQTAIPSDFLCETLPFHDKGQVDNFESYLQNQETFKKFVVFIQKIGGNSVYECVKRALSRIITNELASKYSWNGKKNKYAFCGLNLQKGLTAGIQTNAATKNCSEKDIEGAVKSWLRHAKSRIKKLPSDGSSVQDENV